MVTWYAVLSRGRGTPPPAFLASSCISFCTMAFEHGEGGSSSFSQGLSSARCAVAVSSSALHLKGVHVLVVDVPVHGLGDRVNQALGVLMR